ncbi:MAG: helix-turn-helix domain-containing protein [Carnobacterium sp.]|uniref:helix-turn-helix domain-containing protein n=1 Tax=Carnobacterium sp. TaxID=48221 RepID=UPI002FC682F9
MDQLLTKDQLNELKIIEKLNLYFPNYVTIESISKELEISKSSVIKLVNRIETKNLGLIIIYKKRTGLCLNTSITNIYDRTRLVYLKDSILFNLCLDSFTKSYESPSSFSEKTYISIATFYNRINELNSILTKYSLEFNPKNGEISGLSSNYRFFFYHFFWTCFRMQPCELIDIFIADNSTLLSSLIFEQQNSNLNPIQKKQFLFALFVNFNQITKKKYIEPNFPHLNLSDSLYIYINKIFSKKFYFINKKNLNSEISFFYSFIISFPIKSPLLKLYPSILQSYKLKNSKNYDYSKKLISKLEKSFPGIFDKKEEKLNFLVYVLSVNFSLTNFDYQDDSIDKFNELDLYEKYPEFFVRFLEIFIEFEGNLKTKQITSMSLLKKKYRFKYYLLFLSTIISNYNFKKKYTVQILTDSIIEKNIIKNDLLSKFDKNFIYIEKDIENYDNIDLIVTNLSLDFFYKKDVPTLIVNTPMDMNDFISLDNLLIGDF